MKGWPINKPYRKVKKEIGKDNFAETIAVDEFSCQTRFNPF